jgi:cell division protein ZapA
MSKDVIETAVEIMGRTFHVKCPRSEVASLQLSAKYLEDKLYATRESSQTIGFDRIAIIAALNITHELLSSERHKNQRLRDLKGKIDEALVRYTQMELEPAEEV